MINNLKLTNSGGIRMVLKIIIGSPISTNIPFWRLIKVDAVMFNAYDIIRKKSIYARILKGESLREILNITKDIEIWIDSGGYQIMKKGISISIERVVELYNALDADYFISLDYPLIPGDDYITRYRKITLTLKNYEYLSRKVDKIVIPVIHYSPELEDIRRYISFYREFNNHEFIAFGGFVPPLMAPKGMHNMRTSSILLLVYLRKVFCDKKIHVMGAGSNSMIPILRVLNVYSTDSSTWRVKASYGKIILPWGGERHASPRRANFGGRLVSDDELKAILKVLNRNYFFKEIDDVQSLKRFLFSKFENRAIFNLWVIVNFAKQVKPRSPLFKKLYNMVLKAKHLNSEDIEAILKKIDERRRIPLDELIRKVESIKEKSITIPL